MTTKARMWACTGRQSCTCKGQALRTRFANTLTSIISEKYAPNHTHKLHTVFLSHTQAHINTGEADRANRAWQVDMLRTCLMYWQLLSNLREMKAGRELSPSRRLINEIHMKTQEQLCVCVCVWEWISSCCLCVCCDTVDLMQRTAMHFHISESWLQFWFKNTKINRIADIQHTQRGGDHLYSAEYTYVHRILWQTIIVPFPPLTSTLHFMLYVCTLGPTYCMRHLHKTISYFEKKKHYSFLSTSF